MKKYGESPQTSGRIELGVPRTKAKEAIRNYHKYLKYEVKVEQMFLVADADQSGVLTRDQLTTLLKNYTDEKGLKVEIDDDDLDFIIERCDVSKEGTINVEEAGPALATWMDIAKAKPASGKSSACALL